MNELDRLYEVADDHEAATLDVLRERAGLIWTCRNYGHIWTNQSGDPCEKCGRRQEIRSEPTLST